MLIKPATIKISLHISYFSALYMNMIRGQGTDPPRIRDLYSKNFENLQNIFFFLVSVKIVPWPLNMIHQHKMSTVISKQRVSRQRKCEMSTRYYMKQNTKFEIYSY